MHRVWISNSVQLINTGFMRRSNHRRLVIFSPAFMRTPSLAKLNFTFDDQNTKQKNRLDADFSQNQMATVTFIQTIGSCNFLNAWTKWTGKPLQWVHCVPSNSGRRLISIISLTISGNEHPYWSIVSLMWPFILPPPTTHSNQRRAKEEISRINGWYLIWCYHSNISNKTPALTQHPSSYG